MFAVAAAAMILSAQNVAYAQTDPFEQCFIDCAELYSSETDDDAREETVGELSARCRREVPSCHAIDEAAMRAIGDWCGRATRATPRAPEPAPRDAPPASSGTTREPAFCILPDGTTSADEDCGCPAGTYPLAVATHRSVDRLRSLGVPRGHNVFVCANPMALRGAPGSAEAVGDDVAATVAVYNAALRVLCASEEGGDLVADCATAREVFLAIGSSEGPVDLGPVNDAIAALVATDARHDAELANLRAADIEQSRRIDLLVECLTNEDGHEVSYTDSTGVTQTYACPDFLRGSSADAVEAARQEAARIARETAEQVARAEAERVAAAEAERVARETAERVILAEGGHAYVMVQGYGLVTFNPLVYGNVDHGLPWHIGASLTLGVSLGGGWNFHGGFGIGYGVPNINGVTNVGGFINVGLGAVVHPMAMIGFGFIATHRFTPDVFSAHSVYGAYGDVTFRILPESEWTPTLTIRALLGGSPREQGTGWTVQPDGGLMLLFGAAHF